MDRFKWYSSHSVMMDNIALGGSPFSKSFIDDAYDTFNSNKSGINSLLYVYMRMNTRSNRMQNFYEIFFSIDGNLFEIKDLNPAVDGDPFYVVEVPSGKRINNTLYNNAMAFIIDFIIQRDGMNIRSQISQGKSIALLQVDFDDYVLDTKSVTYKLRELFNKHFVEVLGQM